MDLYQFISSLVKSLAWPTFIVIVILILKKPIATILSSLTISAIKYKDFEANFGQKLNEMENKLETKELPQVKASGNNSEANVENQILKVAETSPAASITMSWSLVEQEIENVSDRFGLPPKNRYESPFMKVKPLVERNYMDKETFNILNDLRVMRNKVTHRHIKENELNYLDAKKYLNVSLTIIEILKGLEN